MVIFHSYVSLPEGRNFQTPIYPSMRVQQHGNGSDLSTDRLIRHVAMSPANKTRPGFIKASGKLT